MLCYATPEAARLLAELEAPLTEGARGLLAPLGRTRTLALIGLLDEIRAAANSSTRHPSNPESTQS